MSDYVSIVLRLCHNTTDKDDEGAEPWVVTNMGPRPHHENHIYKCMKMFNKHFKIIFILFIKINVKLHKINYFNILHFIYY
jgi:hypothetical protein